MTRRKRALRVEEPCTYPWHKLEPREGGRWCPACREVVLDLMHVTEQEAWRRIDAAGGEVCVRMRPGPNGDAEFRAARARVPKVAALAFGAALAACEGGGETTSEPPVIAEPADPVDPAAADPRSPPPPVLERGAPESADLASDPTPSDEETIADGRDHPAHLGEPHNPAHERIRGRRGRVRVIERDGVPSDPFGDL